MAYFWASLYMYIKHNKLQQVRFNTHRGKLPLVTLWYSLCNSASQAHVTSSQFLNCKVCNLVHRAAG